MNLLRESRSTLRLAFPLMAGQLSQMLMGVVDTVMVGHLGITELAALTFINALFHVPFVFGIGLLTGVSVVTSNCRGADDKAGGRGSCRHGLYIGLALGVLMFGLACVVSMNLGRFGQPPEVAARAKGFFLIIMASLIPGLASMALKYHADALNRPWPPFWIFLGGVLLNILLNWLLIPGRLGFPELGFEGAAWGTLIARFAVLGAMILWLLRAEGLKEWIPYRWLRRPDFSEIRRLMSIGFPASLHMLSEVSVFSAAGLMMGRFGQDALAAHQIAITLAGTAFMLPLGLSMALTVRMGEARGAGEVGRFRGIALSGWGLATAYSLLAAMVFLFAGDLLASLFIDAPTAISLAATLLVTVGVFQLFDSIQVASAGMLRGLEDTRLPAVMGFTSYWLIGLPVGALLAFQSGMKASGVWWGLAIGLFMASVMLGPRLWKKTASPQG